MSVPKPPAWVQGDPEKSPVLARRKAGARNANIVQTANKNNAKYDFVLYGDSITMNAADNHMDVWNKYFGKNGMKSAPLGIGGDTVQNLSWRISLGKERFRIPPKVVGLLIGINNLGVDNTNPASMLYNFLLPYLKAVYPTTNFILIGLLPNTTGAAKNKLRLTANANYKLLANKFGMQYVDISKGLVPSDKNQFFDGIHPTGAGYEMLYSNLQPYVMAATKNVKLVEPFKIPKPKLPDFVDKAKDKIVDTGKDVGEKVADAGKDVGGKVADAGKNVGGKVVDVGKNVGGKVVDVGKNVGGKVVDIGKKVGGTLINVGKGIGKVLGPAFKSLYKFLMMILKNWKIALAVVFGLFILYWVSRISGMVKMVTG